MTDPTAEARDLATRYVECLNERRMDALFEILAPDMVSHLRVGNIRGIDRFIALMEETYVAFPGVLWEIDDAVYGPQRAVLRYHFDAVHRAAWMGVPASHRMVHLEGCEILEVEEHRIGQIWNFADVMGLAAQLRAADPLALRIEDPPP